MSRKPIKIGGGSTERMYRDSLKNIFIPAIKAREMIPVLITPVTRVDTELDEDAGISDSFTNRKFPAVMRKTAKELGVTLIDLNRRSVDYINEIGVPSAKGIYLSL